MRGFILIKKISYLIVSLCIYHVAFMQDSIDGIVAAVEDKIILKSDVILNMQLAGVALSQNSFTLERIYNDFLDQMINDKVLLVAAEKDTNIVIDDTMVDVRLNEYISNVINEVGSEENLIQVFNKSIREIKYYYRSQIYDSMLREMYIYNYIGDLDISRKEVEHFYDIYRDSLPLVPAKYSFSMIEIPIEPNENEVNKIKNFQLNLIQKINNGESFEELAQKFSEDPGTASQGGDQGYYQKGTLFPEFEEIAFNLEKNQISDPIRTPLGYHIIKLIDKKDNQIHTKHILNFIKISEQDRLEKLDELNMVYNISINDPGVFDSLAISYKNQYNNDSGVYKDINEDQIPNNIRQLLKSGKEYTLNKPRLNDAQSKYSMIYPYQIINQSQPSLVNDWELIEMYSKNQKQTNLLTDLIEKLKHKTFIKYYN